MHPSSIGGDIPTLATPTKSAFHDHSRLENGDMTMIVMNNNNTNHHSNESSSSSSSSSYPQESGPATKRIRMGASATRADHQRRTLEEKSNIETVMDGGCGTTSFDFDKNARASASTTSRTMNSGADGSVTMRRELLDDFAKQNRQHFEKTSHIGRHPDGVVLTKPVRPKCQAAPHPVISQRSTMPIGVNSSSHAASKSIKKPHTTSTDLHHQTHNHHHHHPHHHPHHPAAYRGPELTPVRIKPRFKKEDVEATNNGYASVAKLAAWLADNPTSNKKVACVRKGANVIAKSRKFEKDLENVIIEENGIEVGGVSEKKQWLKSAFSDDTNSEAPESAPVVNVSDKRKWLAHAFKRGDDDDDENDHVAAAETASEILSVTDKKKWLETAFHKKGADGKRAGKAMSMVNMPRGHGAGRGGGGGDDDATTRAKKKWQENSARRLAARESLGRKTKSSKETTEDGGTMKGETSLVVTAQRDDEGTSAVLESQRNGQAVNDNPMRRDFTCDSETDYMVWEAESTTTPNGGEEWNTAPGTRAKVVEDKTPVDFRAARELLIQRSKQNGNPLSVVSKVQRRKQIFERIDKENKRRSGQFGLLRPSWEPVAEPVEGPTTAYKKTYVEDIVPKKSFEELP